MTDEDMITITVSRLDWFLVVIALHKCIQLRPGMAERLPEADEHDLVRRLREINEFIGSAIDVEEYQDQIS